MKTFTLICLEAKKSELLHDEKDLRRRLFPQPCTYFKPIKFIYSERQ